MTDRDPLSRRFDVLRDPEDLAAPAPSAVRARARGEQIRRRRYAVATGAAALAVAAIAVPAGLLGAGGPDSAPPPAEQPSRTPDPTPEPTPSGPEETTDAGSARDIVTQIPGSFPLAAGWPYDPDDSDQRLVGPTRDLDPATYRACGDEVTLPPGDDTLAARLDIPAQGHRREVRLYATEQEARDASAALRDLYASCPEEPDPDNPITRFNEVADGPLGPDSWAVSSDYGNPAAVGRSATVVARVGNGLLVEQSGDEGNDADGLVEEYAAQLAAPLDALAHLVGVDKPPPGSGAAGGEVSDEELLVDVPLGLDLVDYGGEGRRYGITGPSGEAPGVTGLDPCGRGVFSNEGVASRWAVESTGPELADTREVRVYPDVQAAVAVMTQARAAVRACPLESGDSDIRWRLLDADTGWETVTASYTYVEGAPGGRLIQLVRVGRAVLATSRYGEFSTRSIRLVLAQRTDLARRIAPSLCPWTEAGC